MKDHSGRRSKGGGGGDKHSRLLPQLASMWHALIQSSVRDSLLLLGSVLIAVVVGTALGQIRLNAWNRPFYDALSHHDLDGFLRQLGVFAIIAGVLLVLNVAQKFLTETLKLKLREGLVKDLIGHWLRPMRPFRLANAGDIGVNPDQRVHEDARHLTELTADLATGLLQATMLVVMFIGVLWQISSGFRFHFHDRYYSVPGYMVWAAILYAGSASLLSYAAGRSLIKRNADRYQRESELRIGLVRANEYADAIALAGGEADEARHVERDLAAVLAATWRLVLGLTNLTWITSGYSWFTLVAPIIAAAPLYFFGNLSFGGLMMAAGAFTQVQGSLRWFVDNFSVIADWRATLLRVASFRTAVTDMDSLHRVESQITYEVGAADEYLIEKLEVSSPAGATRLKENKILMKPGERVLIVAEPGAGKTLLFRALAGLWPWGSGSVTRPKGESIYHMPRSAYWPPGSMRAALAYPSEPDEIKDGVYKDALRDLKLQEFEPMLDKDRDWKEELNQDQLTRLAFVRLLIHDPPWVVIDEVLDFVDADSRILVSDVLARRMKDSTIIHIGRELPHDKTFRSVLHLVNDTTRRKLPRRKRRQFGKASPHTTSAPART
ncbi:MAG TPA: ABC transporter ATP-binding protein/permease [Steroidobacteraceae bacterium]|nr:ABC transporter ATP-binding protein/permease [Steroidobacteraceae bacterium]